MGRTATVLTVVGVGLTCLIATLMTKSNSFERDGNIIHPILSAVHC